jgi:protein gp37
MSKTKIEWTQETWNPTTGCTKISAGCKNCYAETMAKRLKAMKNPKYLNGFDLTLHPEVLNLPNTWQKPRTVFVNSMSDMFHSDIPDTYIESVFKIMNKNPQHTFQILTKRARRLVEISNKLFWSRNIWMGVTVEDNSVLERISDLKKVNCFVKFISMEPLLEELSLDNLTGIDWVIVGGESGPKSRPIESVWIKKIKETCHQSNIPFFFKQWGGINKKKTGRLFEGKTWDQMPQKVFSFGM